jgi:hypothetical protein
MCLNVVNFPKRKKGVGYKLCRATKKEGVFVPRFSHFGKNGGCFNKRTGKKTKAKYVIGEKYVANHKNEAISSHSGKTYWAGIHVYKRKKDAEAGIRPRLTMLKVAYFGATAEDDNVIVAKEIIPLEVVE